MARERYLVGVSDEELQYTSPSTPLTPKGKWQNMWYHHKWGILGGTFALVVATVLIVQLVTRVKPDYYITMATTSYIPEAVTDAWKEELLPYGKDLNGDGKVSIQLQAFNVQKDDEYTQLGVNNRQAIMAQLAAGDVMIFAFAPSFYESFIGGMEDGFSFFVPLGIEHEGIQKNDTAFAFDLSGFAKQQWPDYTEEEIEALLPDDVLVGVRVVTESAKDEQKQAQHEHLELLRRYITKTKP